MNRAVLSATYWDLLFKPHFENQDKGSKHVSCRRCISHESLLFASCNILFFLFQPSRYESKPQRIIFIKLIILPKRMMECFALGLDEKLLNAFLFETSERGFLDSPPTKMHKLLIESTEAINNSE